MNKVKRGILLQGRLDALTLDVIETLTDMVENSPIRSKFLDSNAIDVLDILGYAELAICDSKLVLIDISGYHYSIFSSSSRLEALACALEDLVKLINEYEENN